MGVRWRLPSLSGASAQRVSGWMDRGDRSRVRRNRDRGPCDRETIYAIPDEALVGHVGFVVDSVSHVTPMVIGRWEDELLLDGSTRIRLKRHPESGSQGASGPNCASRRGRRHLELEPGGLGLVETLDSQPEH